MLTNIVSQACYWIMGLCLPLELSAQLATVREWVAYLASIPEMR
jgi:hypothetical protein